MGELLLLAPAVSSDAVAALEELLAEAKAGRVIGLAWVALHAGRTFTMDIAGETKNDITYTRGMLLALDDELSKILLPRSPG